jgi:EAL domain-containing protein (putative c-di-GMP-specific phosphodiesterase class I)
LRRKGSSHDLGAKVNNVFRTTATGTWRDDSSGGLALLDVIVLIAMMVTAAAFAVGLVLEAGIPQIPAVIAAAALYMVMAASYLMVSRPAKSAGGSDRLDDLEAALEVIDKDLQRIDKVEDDMSRLDQAMGDGGGEQAGGLSHLAQITQEIEDVHAKIENLRSDLEGEARDQRTKITNDLRGLEALIKQLSADLVSASAETLASAEEEAEAEAEAEPLAEIEKIEPEPEGEDIVFEAETITVAVEQLSEEEDDSVRETEPVEISIEAEEEAVAEAGAVAAEEDMEGAAREAETFAIPVEQEEAAPGGEPAVVEEEKEEAAREAEMFAIPVEQEDEAPESETETAEVEREETAREPETLGISVEQEETAPDRETAAAEQEQEEAAHETETVAAPAEQEEAAPEAEMVAAAAEEELVLGEETSPGLLGERTAEEGDVQSSSEQEIPEAAGVAEIGDSEMLEIISQAIEAGRIDLYLQPTVTLPERRPVYLEAFTRIRTDTDSLIRPRSYVPAAEASGMMPLIDNVLLVKSVQTLRRLGPQSRVKGIFCNISVSTLLDPEFFPELVEFMEENSGLSDSLVFEISQPALAGLGQAELGALDTLAALGYGFSLDHVAGFDLDFVGLRDRSFRFVKSDARTFLRGNDVQGGGFSLADMMRALDDFDIKLIVEKVADEDTVAALLDRGINLAQGYLFGGPKPLDAALLSEIEGTGRA